MNKNEIYKYFIFIPVTCFVVLVIISGYIVLDKMGFWEYPITPKEEKTELVEAEVHKVNGLPLKIRKGDEPVDINKASVEELMRLPGIGQAKANAIVNQRIKMNGFYSVDDLACTEGISTKTLETLREFITVSEYKGEE